MITLGDIFIGNFRESQSFGANPDYYKQFGLAGHEGIDFATPTGTPILVATDGVVVRDFDDPVAGRNYGIYVAVWDKIQNCATYYCHLASNVVSVGQAVVKGQLLGYSNNTGNTTGPHLHFGLCKTDAQGARINTDNGFSGFVNADDGRIAQWNITNPTEPVKPPEITVPETPTDDEARAIDVLRFAFANLLEDDKYKGGNLEGFVRGMTEEHKNYADYEQKASQLNTLIEKWFKEWNLAEDPNKSHQVILEEEMGTFLTIEQKAETYREAIEALVGHFATDIPLLEALSAEKKDKQTLTDQVKTLTQTISDLKKKQNIKYAFNLFGFPVKIYERG